MEEEKHTYENGFFSSYKVHAFALIFGGRHRSLGRTLAPPKYRIRDPGKMTLQVHTFSLGAR